jgi:hypothetical protein
MIEQTFSQALVSPGFTLDLAILLALPEKEGYSNCNFHSISRGRDREGPE